jgi:hypothetical protein
VLFVDHDPRRPVKAGREAGLISGKVRRARDRHGQVDVQLVLIDVHHTVDEMHVVVTIRWRYRNDGLERRGIAHGHLYRIETSQEIPNMLTRLTIPA